jgi:zinc protease
VPVIAMEMAWKGGSAHEPLDRSGAGWVLAYMMNEGAGRYDTRAYGARMEDLSMEFACGVWVDWTQCSLMTLKDTADESFEMMRLAFTEPRLDTEPFERAKRELGVNIRREEGSPRAVASKAMNQAIVPGHAYARMATPESVARVRKQDVKALMRQLMVRDRLLVVVVGDITADELKPRLDQMFGGLPETSALPALPDAVARPPTREPVVKVLPQPQTLVMFSGPGIRRDDPDFFAAYLLNYILGGGGLSSRLSDELRDKRGLTYGVGTGLSIQPHLQRWTGSVSTMNDKADEVVRIVRENIARLGAEGPTAQELADAKAYITGAFPLAFESNAKVARNLLGFRQDDQPADYVQHRNSYLEAVTLEDMKRVAAKYMNADAFTFVMVGQPALD